MLLCSCALIIFWHLYLFLFYLLFHQIVIFITHVTSYVYKAPKSCSTVDQAVLRTSMQQLILVRTCHATKEKQNVLNKHIIYRKSTSQLPPHLIDNCIFTYVFHYNSVLLTDNKCNLSIRHQKHTK